MREATELLMTVEFMKRDVADAVQLTERVKRKVDTILFKEEVNDEIIVARKNLDYLMETLTELSELMDDMANVVEDRIYIPLLVVQ